jgi:hypothetical protein
VNSVRLYALADSLGISLEIDPNTEVRVSGERKGQVFFGKLPVAFPLKVVSSRLDKDAYMLLLRSTGNLVLLAIATPEKGWEKVVVHILNVAKMTNKPSQLFETNRAWMTMTVKDMLCLLEPAVVASFAKTSSHTWAPLL